MSASQTLLAALEKQSPGGYQPGAAPAAEPTAWAAMALAKAGRQRAAVRAADFLAKLQASDGSVGVTADQPTPQWPTSLAILAWKAVSPSKYHDNVHRAAAWALESKGRTAPRKRQIGHDTTLVGWSWATDTHSWLEPTAMFVKALRTAGHSKHARTREGVRMLVDRLLPSGGCNYGNTMVLGQELLPHVQPTGLVLWALGDMPIDDPRIDRAIEYLLESLGPDTATASLSYGLMGLAAHGRLPSAAQGWIETAAQRELAKKPSPYKLALLLNVRQQSPAEQVAATGSY